MPSRSPPRSPAKADAILIAAQSGRALAAAARRAGLVPYVADLFGDEDTRALSAAYQPLRGRFGARPARRVVRIALERLAGAAGAHLRGIVLGSGFEAAPDLIAEIAGRYRLLGAAPDTVAWLKDPLRLAALLDSLGIPHPPVTRSAVPDPEHWLAKRQGGSGGGHVGPARAGPPPAGCYHQHRVPGRPYGISFLADGADCEVLAVTEQWVAPSRAQPFRYGGALDPGQIAPEWRDEMAEAVRRIVRATGLRGLASADLLVEGGGWWLLEVNPRPGATLDLLDRRAIPLLQRHIAASLGELGVPERPPTGAAASEILYAEGPLAAVPCLRWPDFVADRPLPGQRIGAGAPVCTVRAVAEGPEAARALLRSRVALVRKLLREEHEHGQAAAPPQRQHAGKAAGRGAHP